MQIMKQKRILFVASLPTKRLNFDGETIKSRDVLTCLRTFDNCKYTIIDYRKNKYIQTIKMLLHVMFRRFDSIIISKCVVGGSYALHLILKFAKKRNLKNITFYLIGNGGTGFENRKLYLEDLKKCRNIIVESPIVQEELKKLDIDDRISIFPCIKPSYELEPLPREYGSEEKPLRAIFFSRINEKKGVMDAIDAVILANEKSHKVIYTLDIAGGVSQQEEVVRFAAKVVEKCEQYDFLHYLGMSLHIKDIHSYEELQSYDLHVFPSKFIQECAPGSILDMFVAGIPTISSRFPSVKYLLNDSNSYFFNGGNIEELADKLIYIYNHKEELSKKRILSHDEYIKYTDKVFIEFLKDKGVIE